jgi:hypothetical protein
MSVLTNELPARLTVDLLVEDAQGRAISTLTAKDFQVSVAGRTPASVQVTQFRKPPTMMLASLLLGPAAKDGRLDESHIQRNSRNFFGYYLVELIARLKCAWKALLRF